MKNHKSILILGAGIYQVPLIIEAQKRGLYTIVASISGNYPGFTLADKVYFVDTTDKCSLLKIAQNEKVNAIATTGTDVAVKTIGYVCSKMGLPGIDEKAAEIITDKALMKEAFVKGGVTTARFIRVCTIEETFAAAEIIGFPVVLKIVDKSGSRGIIKISEKEQIVNAYEAAKEFTNSDHLIVEKYVEGIEFGIDAFVQHGKLISIIPHGKYVYLSGKCGIPIGHYCPMPYSNRLYNNIVSETYKIVNSIGLDNCAVNIDAFILPNDEVSIIEAAGRCGATGIPEVISAYTGRNYYGCILDCALGNEVASFETIKGTPSASLLIFSKKSGNLRNICYKFGGHSYSNDEIEIEGKIKVCLDVVPGTPIHMFQNGTDRIGMAVLTDSSYDVLQDTVNKFRDNLYITVE